MAKYFIVTLFLFSSVLFGTAAKADEVRLGFGFQDVEVEGIGGVKGKEKGNAITLEYVTDEVEFLDFALKPKAYIGGTLNISGDTSYGGAGLLWDTDLSNAFNVEFSFGAVIHDGELELPLPSTATSAAELAEFERLNAENIEFGSRVLFRSQFAAGYRVSEDINLQIYYEHLSHGKILSNGSNEGLDTLGIRIGKRF